jgi:hypothetical protein
MILNRRTLLKSTLALPAVAAAPARGRMRTLEGTGRVWDIWRIPGRFTKNPDIIRFPNGRMMLVFCETDQHWALKFSRITTLESTDGGKTWGNSRVIAEADIRKGEERWVTPRLSRLRSGRLVIICDHDDYHYYHEDRPSGIWIWFSDDEGKSWSAPKLTGVPGIEPGRVLELADGTLLMNAHMAFRDNFKMAEFVMRSTDGGRSWKDLAVIAKDKVHNHVEGHILEHSSGTLVCILRENNHNGYPSYVAFSPDQGRTWSRPRALPFSGDRPFAGELPDGRVLVTYRNQLGNKGTHGWLGDIFVDDGWQPGGVHYGDEVSLKDGLLHLANRPDGLTQYILMPPESFRCDIVLEARLKVEGPPDAPIAVMNVGRHGLTLNILRDQIWCDFRRGGITTARVDVVHKVDMTEEHTLRLQTRAGRMWVAVDGKEVIHGVMIREWPLEPTWFGRPKESKGAVMFRSATWQSVNETEPHVYWAWNARSGKYPDQYTIDRMLEINPNTPGPDRNPDNGYSSWLQLPTGEIYMVDYTTRGDRAPAGHLYAARFTTEDFSR